MNYKNDFEIFKNQPHITYLDNAATTQTPNVVLNKVFEYKKFFNSNPHRGGHYLGIKSTQMYEESREQVKNFLNAKFSDEIIFTKSCTESINLVAYSYALENLNENDEILLAITNHHSNIIPWQFVSKKTGAKIKYLYCDSYGQILDDEIEKSFNSNTKIVAISHVTNAFGVIHPIEKIISIAKNFSCKILIDAAQSCAHFKYDLQKLDIDFLSFSGHKMFSLMGIGVLYIKKDLQETMNPFLMGGNMIDYVNEKDSTFAVGSKKFEAGTPNVEAAISLCESIKYIEKISFEKIKEIEENLLIYAYNSISKLDFLEVYLPNTLEKNSSILSFNIKSIHSHDVGTILDSNNVAIRTGHHCCQPFMKFMNLNTTCRASFSFYNTKEDIDQLVLAIKKVRRFL